MADDSLVVGFCSLQQTRLLSYGQPYPRVRVQYLALNSHQPLTIFLEIIIVLLPFTDSTVQLIVASISLVNHTVIKIKSREFLSPGRTGPGGGCEKRKRKRKREYNFETTSQRVHPRVSKNNAQHQHQHNIVKFEVEELAS